MNSETEKTMSNTSEDQNNLTKVTGEQRLKEILKTEYDCPDYVIDSIIEAKPDHIHYENLSEAALRFAAQELKPLIDLMPKQKS